MKLNAYLNYGGNCAEAFRFYEQHLGGKITMMLTFDQMPGDKSQLPPNADKLVMHARITIAGTEVMGSDNPNNYEPMRSAYLILSLESDAEAERIYALLSEDAEIFMKMEETFFATRFATLRDKFGTSWMLIHQRPPQA
jgi:PhnB protein